MSAQSPFFSIIIPSYNRAGPLRTCLQSLADLDYPAGAFETVVVDDGGREPLDGLITEFKEHLAIRLLRQDNAGPGAARNTGAQAARGDYLAFTDDDCQPASDWLRTLAAGHAEYPDSLLGGQTLNGLTDNLYAEASQSLQAWLYDYFERHPSPMRFFASNNLSLPTAAFLELGGFDTETLRYASEDRELCGRWQATGGRLSYLPQARVFHYHHLDARRFIGQHFAYGKGAYRLRLARERRGLPPLAGDPNWMRASLLEYPFADNGMGRGVQLSALAFCTHVANVAGYAYERFLGS